MASLWIVVCLPAEAGRDLVGALSHAMAPFEQYEGHSADRDLWDWWTIRGDSDGSGFWVLPDFVNDRRIVHDDPNERGEILPGRSGMCAGGPRGLLDLGRPRRVAEAAAGQAWDLWHRLARELPPASSLSKFLARGGFNEEGRRTDQRNVDDYRSQPLIESFLAEHPQIDEARRFMAMTDPVTSFAADRADFIEREADRATYRTHVLTLDGWWVESTIMAIHKTCDTEACEHLLQGPSAELNIAHYLEMLSDDVVMVNVKCHS